MMQNQEYGRTNGSETSASIEVCKTAKEQGMYSNIDFDNVEDILDFSAPHGIRSITNETPKLPTKLPKLITREPIKLPTISNIATDNETNCKNDEAKKNFQCIFYGSTFIRLGYLNNHLQVHSGGKPYFCPICRKQFSSNDYMLTHSYHHHMDKEHYCLVCGEVYFNLENFTKHCHTHDHSEYIKLAIGTDDKAESQKEAENDASVATSSKQLESISSGTIKKVNDSFSSEYITCVKNPLNLSHHKAISINNNATSLLDDARLSDGLIVSIYIYKCGKFCSMI